MRDALREIATDCMRVLGGDNGSLDAPPGRLETMRSRLAVRAGAYAASLRAIGVREQDVTAEVQRMVPAATPSLPRTIGAREAICRWCAEACVAAAQDARATPTSQRP